MLFNKALSQVTGTKDILFILITSCTDMTEANMKSLEKVYGEEVVERLTSCEFYFTMQFKGLCDALVAARKEVYCSAKDSLDNFIHNKPYKAFLSSWVDWWHNWRRFIFCASSASEAAQRKNEAEVIHASCLMGIKINYFCLMLRMPTRDFLCCSAEQRGNLVHPSGHWPPQEKAGKGKKGISCSVLKLSNQPGPVRQPYADPPQTDAIHHSHIHFLYIPIAISRNSAQIHCSVMPTICNNMPVHRSSVSNGCNSMPTQCHSALIHHNSRPTDCNSTSTHH